MSDSVAGKDDGPSSASVTTHVAAGSELLVYDAPSDGPVMPTLGGVLAPPGAMTLTRKVAGAYSKVRPLSLAYSLTVTALEPTLSPFPASFGVAPQLSKVTRLGVTVAMLGSADVTSKTRVVLPVRLQPFLLSPLVGTTASTVEPVPPTRIGR